jgi:hypothetical protein
MDTVRNDTRAGTLTTYQSTPGGMRISEGSESYEAPLDGRDHPRNGNPHTTVSLKLVDDYTLEETDKTDGKVTGGMRATIAQDGKSMRVEFSSNARGQTMTYTAEKVH